MQQLKPETRYHSNGQICFKRVIGKKGSWAERIYNESGYLLSYKDSTGYFEEWTYDEACNTLTNEDSNPK